MSKNSGKTIKLFLADGASDGIITAEIMNWTGHVLFAPRSRVAGLLSRPESQRTGVYLLVGKDGSDATRDCVYVGEGDNVGVRIAIHNKDEDKQFWECACIVTSKDLNLTKAHVRYLESSLIQSVKREGRASLINKSDPGFDLLPEADISDMDEFLLRLQVLLPVLGLQFLRPTPIVTRSQPIADGGASDALGWNEQRDRATTDRSRPTAYGAESPIFHFAIHGASARAMEVGGQMVVLQGSSARAENQNSLGSNIRSAKEQMISSGKLIEAGVGSLLFKEDVAFSSPSAAAQAIAGTSRNGRADWVTSDGVTYADWQQQQINTAIDMSATDASMDNGEHLDSLKPSAQKGGLLNEVQ